MDGPILLRIDGAVESPQELGYGDLLDVPESERVLDVSRFHPGRRGDGVTLESLLRRARPRAGASYLTLHAGRDDFHVSVPLEAVRSEGVVVFRLGDRPLGPDQGGPVRFLIRDPAACRSDELDDCANVKYLDRIELTVGRGLDTRPEDEAAHRSLHERQGG